MRLYDKRTDIINAFVNNHIYPAEVEKDVHYGSEKSEPKFEESVAERTKMRRQKNLTMNNQTLQICLI